MFDRNSLIDDIFDQNWAVVVTLMIMIGVVTRAIYQHFTHPLYSIPGPFWASVSHLYLTWIISSVPTYGLELHRKHGPLVRLAPDMLSFSDPKDLPIVYHRYADKPAFYGSWMFGKFAAMFQSLSHQDHAAKKRLVAPLCSLKAMKEHESKISDRVSEFCEKIKERSVEPGAKLDFAEHLRWFLSDVWSQLVYGEAIGCIAQGKDVDGLLLALQNIYALNASGAVMPWLQPLLRSQNLQKYFWSYTKTFRSMTKLFTHFDKMLEQWDKKPAIKKTKLFFDGLYNTASGSNSPMTRDDFKAEVITFTAATLDGVAAFVSPFLENMIQHPEVCKKVVAEIDAANLQGALSSPVALYEEIIELPYFTACMKETLRRDSPAQTILPRLVSKGGYSLHGHYIPEGIQMGASPFIIHRNADIFGADPESFIPERWLENPDQVFQMERFGMWWGYGDRECAGKQYAQMETGKLCLQLLRQFEFHNAPVIPGQKYVHKRWAVNMFWEHWLVFKTRYKE